MKAMSRISNWVFAIVCLGGIVFAGFQVGCHTGPAAPEVDDRGRKVYPLGEEIYESGIDGELVFEYIMVDDHEYLVAKGFRRYGLTHSPKCLCLTNRLEASN